MTPTEIIATRLLGWVRVEPTRDDPKVYEHPTGSTAYVGGELDGTGYGPVGGADWPDLTDYNCIRRMEDALAERQMLKRYMMTLDGEFTVNASDPMPGTCITWQSFAMLRATADQRVEAAVKVLEGVQ